MIKLTFEVPDDADTRRFTDWFSVPHNPVDFTGQRWQGRRDGMLNNCDNDHTIDATLIEMSRT